MAKKDFGTRWGWLLGLVLALSAGGAEAGLRGADLNATRTVLVGDWLRLKLEVLGLRLSFPAYRIHLELDEENAIVFTFLASGGLADHLTEEADRREAEKMLSYHAAGIRERVEKLLQDEFPDLWSSFDAKVDFKGRFLGPGEEWDDPPRTLGFWKGEGFHWNE